MTAPAAALDVPSASCSIPIIDFAPFRADTTSTEEKQFVADAILASFKRWGFVYLVNYGMREDALDRMFSMSQRFFALPTEVKLLAPHPPSGTHHRGYSTPGREKIVQSASTNEKPSPQDVKEHFECGNEQDPEMPNIWLPEEALPGFRSQCMEFFSICFQLELSILRALAIGFRLPEDYFASCHERANNQLRLLHYPSVSAEALRTNAVSRITPHSDYGSITLLFQDAVGGLEVEDPESPGNFMPVPPNSGTVVVNAGDFLMHWSNGTIRSAIHRVRAPQAQDEGGDIPERYSIPYFCIADWDTIVDCVPGTFGEEKRKLYEPVSAKEYLMKRFAASY